MDDRFTNEPSPHGGSQWKRSVVFAAIVVLALALLAVGIALLRPFEAQPPTPIDGSLSSTSRSNGASFPRELRDALGEKLIIPQPPQRIASQTLGSDEILLAIGSSDRIVALSSFALDPRYSNVVEPARALSVPLTREVEQILQVNPDLIFVASYSRAETIELLRQAGAPVFRFANFDRVEDIKSNIRTIGYAIGEEDKAESLVAQMEREIEAARARIPAVSERPRIMSFDPLGFTAGANTLFDDLVRVAGAVNISAEQGVEGFAKLSAEQIIAWQPGFIVIGANQGEFEKARERLLANPAIGASRAGQSGRIIIVDNRYFLTVSHHIVHAIETLIDGLYQRGDRR